MIYIEKSSTPKTLKKEDENNSHKPHYTNILSNTPDRYITSQNEKLQDIHHKYKSDKDLLSVDSHISVRKILRQINEI